MLVALHSSLFCFNLKNISQYEGLVLNFKALHYKKNDLQSSLCSNMNYTFSNHLSQNQLQPPLGCLGRRMDRRRSPRISSVYYFLNICKTQHEAWILSQVLTTMKNFHKSYIGGEIWQCIKSINVEVSFTNLSHLVSLQEMIFQICPALSFDCQSKIASSASLNQSS